MSHSFVVLARRLGRAFSFVAAADNVNGMVGSVGWTVVKDHGMSLLISFSSSSSSLSAILARGGLESTLEDGIGQQHILHNDFLHLILA